MEAGSCPSSVSWIQMTFPLVISFECHRFSFGPVQLIRPRSSLHCNPPLCAVPQPRRVLCHCCCSSLFGGALQLQAPYALYSSVCLCVMFLQNALLCGWNQTALSKRNSSIKLKWNIWTSWKQNVLLFCMGEFRKKVNSFSVVESAAGGGERGKDLSKWPGHYFLLTQFWWSELETVSEHQAANMGRWYFSLDPKANSQLSVN